MTYSRAASVLCPLPEISFHRFGRPMHEMLPSEFRACKVVLLAYKKHSPIGQHSTRDITNLGSKAVVRSLNLGFVWAEAGDTRRRGRVARDRDNQESATYTDTPQLPPRHPFSQTSSTRSPASKTSPPRTTQDLGSLYNTISTLRLLLLPCVLLQFLIRAGVAPLLHD